MFKLDATGQITNLHNFNGGDGGELENDPGGKNPTGGVLRNAAGVLYGTTSGGGVSRGGVVYQLNVDSGAKTVLHTFTGKADGGPPQGPLVGDSAGNLYGTTSAGGDLTCNAANGGCGRATRRVLPRVFGPSLRGLRVKTSSGTCPRHTI